MSIKTNPNSRESFKEYILRSLGAPMIQINVTDDQVEQAVEEAIKWFHDYHYNGTEEIYFVKTLDVTDVTNKYITLPDSIIGVTDVYSIAQTAFSLSGGMWSGGYQMILDLAFNMSNGSVLSYYMNQMNYDFISQIIVGQTPIRYNSHQNRVYIDKSWDRYVVGMNIIIDAYQKMDPEVYTEMWSDRWLLRFATAKVKLQWGNNVSKYTGMQLPAGVSFNGDRILQEAREEIREIEDKMLADYSVPPRDYVG